MPKVGDVLSHAEMCMVEGKSLQQGMHFRSGATRHSVILMSRQRSSRYADGIAEDGKTIHYVGHDEPGDRDQLLDQPLARGTGTLTENGKFFKAAVEAKQGLRAELVRVYEKLKTGIWVYNGQFLLRDARMVEDDRRRVCLFELVLATDPDAVKASESAIPESLGRLIPTDVKLRVWERDRARCALCGATQDLHFDHIIPYSRGGSSQDPRNVQLLCRSCNLKKSDEIV